MKPDFERVAGLGCRFRVLIMRIERLLAHLKEKIPLSVGVLLSENMPSTRHRMA